MRTMAMARQPDGVKLIYIWQHIYMAMNNQLRELLSFVNVQKGKNVLRHETPSMITPSLGQSLAEEPAASRCSSALLSTVALAPRREAANWIAN